MFDKCFKIQVTYTFWPIFKKDGRKSDKDLGSFIAPNIFVK